MCVISLFIRTIVLSFFHNQDFSRVNIKNNDDGEGKYSRISLSCYREDSSSPETCNNGVGSTTSRGEMTSVRTSCYCKHEGDTARKKDNDIVVHNGNRHSAASKKSMVSNRICGNGRESCKRARHVTNEETVLNIYDFTCLSFRHPNILFTITALSVAA